MSFSARVLGLLVFLTSLPALAQSPINEVARAHFTAGVNLLQDPDGARYEEAYREFRAAYAESPSWKILGNLGISAMKLERDGEAIEAFEKYLTEGGSQIEADERAQFQRDLATLRAGVVRLSFDSAPSGALIEDERQPSTGSPIRNSYGPLNQKMVLGVRAGRHRFTARLAGRQDETWEVELSPRQQLAHSFQLSSSPAAGSGAVSRADTSQPAAPHQGGDGLRVASYVAFGVGAVGLGAGTFFGVQAKGKYDDANQLTNDNCGSGGDCGLTTENYGRWKDWGDKADGAKTLSLASFIVGGVGVATGVTLLVLSSGKKTHAEAATIEPLVGLGNFGLRGSF